MDQRFRSSSSSKLFNQNYKSTNHQLYPNSMRKSRRNPIFQNGMYTSVTQKYFNRISQTKLNQQNNIHIVSYDDYCGCQQNLQPCQNIMSLIKPNKIIQMKKQYQKQQIIGLKQPRQYYRAKYFQHLPKYFPQIFHIQLINLISNLDQQPNIMSFLGLSAIFYHIKTQYVTYFLYNDLKKSLRRKQNFMNQLQIQLIQYQIKMNELQQISKQYRLPFNIFIMDFYQSFGANIIPLANFSKFLKLIIKKGLRVLLKMLGYILGKKKDVILDLLRHYQQSILKFKQLSRQFSWQLFIQDFYKII